MNGLTYGSVCSGIEAASVAWEPLGWKAAWFSEIEAFPSAVLAHHWPDVPNLGDMLALPARVDAGEIGAPDVLVGGTPCQAFSVAGNRESLADARGGLTLAYVELADAIDRQRARDGRDPCIVVWENVPGVLSTKDNAFGCFLAGLAGEDVPLLPPGKRWTNAGLVLGPKRAVAWRILDAQYFGLAQRRRRVFVVASARDRFDPSQVLLEFDGLRRDSAPCRKTGQNATTDAGIRTASADSADAVTSLCTTFDRQSSGEYGTQPVANTISARDYKSASDLVMELPVGANTFAQNTRDEVRLLGGDGEIAGALAAQPGMKQTTYVAPQTIPILEPGARTGKSTTDVRAGLGVGDDGDPMFTLQAGKQHGLAHTVALRGREGGATAEVGGEVATALRASSGGGDKPHVLAFHHNAQASQLPGESRDTSVSDSLTCSQQAAAVGMAVRRLTPRECARLQGFPDDHAQVPYRGKPAADGPMYKAYGNSMAVPCMRWIGRRIVKHLNGAL